MQSRKLSLSSSFFCLTAISAIAGLTIACELGVAVFGIAAIIVIIGFCLADSIWRIGERSGLVLILISLAVAWLNWNRSFSENVSAPFDKHAKTVAVLLLWLMIVKSWQRWKERDRIFLSAVSFFSILFAIGAKFDGRLFAIFLVYVLAALCSGLTRELERSSDKYRKSFAIHGNKTRLVSIAHAKIGLMMRSVSLLRLTRVAATVFVLILLFALPIFWVSPRLIHNSTLNGNAVNGDGKIVGFSDRMTLGNIGTLQQSDALVMRVRIENVTVNDEIRNLRWRGAAMDFFNGLEWRRTSQAKSEAEQIDENLFKIAATKDITKLVRQTFYLEPLATSALFAAPRLIAIEGALPFVLSDAEGGVVSRAHPQSSLTYRAYSEIESNNLIDSSVRESENRAANANQTAQNPAAQNLAPQNFVRYLQLPVSVDVRIAQLARRIVNEAQAKNDFARAQALESYLRSNFTYSLEMKASGDNPLADFLFNRREGHCEYFASSMAVMLRTQGIPARVVTGFQIGEYNAPSGLYIVRQRDAHAWVEALLPDASDDTNKVWMSFDPTPAWNRAAIGNSNVWLGKFKPYVEAFDAWWSQYIVVYGKQEQQWLARSVQEKIGTQRQSFEKFAIGFFTKWRDWWQQQQHQIPFAPQSRVSDNRNAGGKRITNYLWLFVLLILPTILLATLWFVRRGLFKQNRKLKQPEAVELPKNCEFYHQMTEILAARGINRDATKTPVEFALTVGSPEALSLTKAFERVRYGGRDLSAPELAQVRESLQRLATSFSRERSE